MASGGNHPPATPATVSGPGALSKRTDGNAPSQAARYISGGDYGSGGLMGVQNGAPMAAAAQPGSAPASANQQSMAEQQGPTVTPLTQPTERPHEPVTAGADAGPGPGSDALRLMSPNTQGGATSRQMIQGFAARPDASPQLRQLAAKLGG